MNIFIIIRRKDSFSNLPPFLCRITTFAVLLLYMATTVHAGITVQQPGNIIVSGKITSTDNIPVVGASIGIKGESTKMFSNDQGEYRISASENAVLVFSNIGYESQEVPVNKRTRIDVVLLTQVIHLDEVVAVGYGTLQRSDVTGAITSVKLDDVDEQKVTSFTEALQGKVAGVNIVTNTGEPGGAVSFNIRGMTSITGSNQPLIVIDGQPIESDFSASTAARGLDGSADITPADPLAAINPNDIASIEILKDASSTAIYGSRGANGVVLITTKEGSGIRDRVNFSSRFDISQLPKKIAMLDTYQFMMYKNEAAANDGADPVYNQTQLDTFDRMPNHNWQDLVYRNAMSQDYHFSVAGNERNKWNYRLAANYTDAQSIITNAGFKRGGVRLNYTRHVSNRLKVSLRTYAAFTHRNFGANSNWTGIAGGSVVLGAMAFNPLRGPFAPSEDGLDESSEFDMSLANNPFILLHNASDHTSVRTFISNLSLDYKILPSLTYQVRAGVNDLLAQRQLYHPTGTFLGNTAPNGYGAQASNNNYNYVIDHLLTFRKVYNRVHSVNAVGGYSWQQWFRKSGSVINMDFPSNTMGYEAMQRAAYPGRFYNYNEDRALSSFLGRVNYTYDRRYSLMATGRYDGSSRLAPGHKWLFYPSLGVSWNATNEKFFKQYFQNSSLSSLRLRSSVGVSGNDNVRVGGSQESYALNFANIGTGIIPGYVLSDFENPYLTWERTLQYNVGADLGFLKNKLTLTVDAYSKETTRLLINLSLPSSAGMGSYFTNVGRVVNKGIDIEANYNVFRSRNKSLSFSANISPISSKIKDMGEAQIIYGRSFMADGGMALNQPLTAALPGHTISSFWGYKTNGIYQNQAEIDNDPALANDAARSSVRPGMVKYVDINGDGMISDADKTVIGSALADFTYGFSTDFSYKRFSASMTIFGSYGSELLNLNRWMLGSGHANNTFNMMLDAYEGRWYGEGTSNLYPALTTNSMRLQQRFPDWMVEDASFIRLQNLTLGYSIPLPEKYRLGDLKVSLTGTNLLTLTKYTGYDPNINSFGHSSLNNGVDVATLGQGRSYSMTLKLMF